MNNESISIKSHNFSKKFGQNFITDTNLLSAIVSDAEIGEQDLVLEVGAGAGTLTEALCSKAKYVVSYEIDKTLEPLLSSRLSECKNLEIIYKDALKEHSEVILAKFNAPYKVVANLPYYITTPLIFKFLEDIENIQSITVMVQKEVAERITSKEGNKTYGIISAIVQFYASAQIKRIVKRDMFFPSPDVDSAVLHLVRTDKYTSRCKPLVFSKCVQTAFAMRRKTLLNNLSAGYGFSKADALQILALSGLNPLVRGEEIGRAHV